VSETERDAEAFCCPNCQVVGVSVDEDGCCVTCGVDALIVTLAARLRSLPGGEPFGTFRLDGADDWVTVGGSDKAFVDHIARAVLAYTTSGARVPVTESGEPGGARCYDCGLPYSDPGFADLVVPHTIWNEHLSPKKNEGGLLCPTCMVRAAEKAGVSCDAVFGSGPFARVTESEVEPAPAVKVWGVFQGGIMVDWSSDPEDAQWRAERLTGIVPYVQCLALVPSSTGAPSE